MGGGEGPEGKRGREHGREHGEGKKGRGEGRGEGRVLKLNYPVSK